MVNPKALISPEALAEELAISTRSLTNWRRRKAGPPFLKLSGGLVRYRRSDVDSWLASKAAGSTETAAAC